MAIIGRRNLLSIVRESAPGLYLDGGDTGEILLPGRYIPRDLAQGDKLDVFVYLDSEDRLVATTETPLVMAGEFAQLEVIAFNPAIGAFLTWGLSKDLLLPFREQENPVRVGDRVIVHVYLDAKSNRIVATTRLNRHLNRQAPTYSRGQPVAFLVLGKTPVGYNVIVENAYRGLIYHDNVSARLEPGQKLNGFIRGVRPDGKIDLSLDASGYKRVAALTDRIVQLLERHGGRLGFDDDSSPEEIRESFGASKKAFKQALGALYKERRIRFLKPGIELLKVREEK